MVYQRCARAGCSANTKRAGGMARRTIPAWIIDNQTSVPVYARLKSKHDNVACARCARRLVEIAASCAATSVSSSNSLLCDEVIDFDDPESFSQSSTARSLMSALDSTESPASLQPAINEFTQSALQSVNISNFSNNQHEIQTPLSVALVRLQRVQQSAFARAFTPFVDHRPIHPIASSATPYIVHGLPTHTNFVFNVGINASADIVPTPNRSSVKQRGARCGYRKILTLKQKRRLLAYIDEPMTSAEWNGLTKRNRILLRAERYKRKGFNRQQISLYRAYVQRELEKQKSDRMAGTDAKSGGRGSLSLTKAQEKAVYDWVIVLRNGETAMSVSLYDVIDHVNEKYKRSIGYGWVRRFMRRQGLSFRARTTVKNLDSTEIQDTAAQYRVLKKELLAMDPRRLFNMDETGICFEMPSNRTLAKRGTRSVAITTNGYERLRVTVILCCSAWGKKLPPLIIRHSQAKVVNQLQKTNLPVLGKQLMNPCRRIISQNKLVEDVEVSVYDAMKCDNREYDEIESCSDTENDDDEPIVTTITRNRQKSFEKEARTQRKQDAAKDRASARFDWLHSNEASEDADDSDFEYDSANDDVDSDNEIEGERMSF